MVIILEIILVIECYLTDVDEHVVDSSNTRETVHLPTEEG